VEIHSCFVYILFYFLISHILIY